MRESLLAVAATGLFQPLWSNRILGEWHRAAQRYGTDADHDAAAAITRASAGFPHATIKPQPGLESRLHLPDENDLHVLAVAIASSADAIITLNAKDFPRAILSAEGLDRRDPDSLLWDLWSHHPSTVTAALEQVRTRASELSGSEKSLAPMLKRAKLTRLARAITQP
jgi:hypothetical protein